MSLDLSLKYNLDGNDIVVFETNTTHNLTSMADEANIYDILWRPNKNGFKKAKDIINKLEKGLKDLKARPDYYKQFGAINVWGTYNDFVSFVEEVLMACKKYPNAQIITSV